MKTITDATSITKTTKATENQSSPPQHYQTITITIIITIINISNKNTTIIITTINISNKNTTIIITIINISNKKYLTHNNKKQ